MPLLVLLLALFVPRVTLFLLWLVTDWFRGVFATPLWPVLGFFFLPLTTLWYSMVVKFFGGEWGIIPILGAILTVLFDLAPYRFRRRRIIVVDS